MTDLERHWLERLQVIGKVQSRYLWILLITMIFYGALQERVSVDTDPLKTPIVDIEISGSFVLGFGPALISFFVLAITGTMRATRTARAKLNLGRGDWSGEELDTSPNALDLAFYTTPQSPKPIAVVTHFSDVAFLALSPYEAACQLGACSWYSARCRGCRPSGSSATNSCAGFKTFRDSGEPGKARFLSAALPPGAQRQYGQ
ncbi:MAG: hypothetical protein DMD87_29985 [Candidatus Rokuibacteriota bacterium]|nr:MAG: hypothetical protein DMD87_29985 [Candidatus Rokubacteria bacterium]